MGIPTTCIGAYPKPDYVPVTDWFILEDGATSRGGDVTRQYSDVMADADDEVEALLVRGTGDAVRDQVEAGIDVPTDGEIRRENYIHYHCRHMTGFDFVNLTPRSSRNDAYVAELPTIRGKVEATSTDFLERDFRVAQSFTDRPIKITVPGPVTIMDTTVNAHYADEGELARDLAVAVNAGVRRLAAAGCRYIQIDEPVFARKPDAALAFGIEGLDRCFEGIGDDVVKVMHMCCGYPNHLDDEDYPKADRESYMRLARAVDESRVDQVSLEDAHRHNDLSLLELFERSTVILGSIAVARSRVETVEEVRQRLAAALEHIDRSRLAAAPDCGLGFLGTDLARRKLAVLCQAAQSL